MQTIAIARAEVAVCRRGTDPPPELSDDSKVIDAIHEHEHEHEGVGVDVSVTDPLADPEQAPHEYRVASAWWDDLPRADTIVAAVAGDKDKALALGDLNHRRIQGGPPVDVDAAFDAAAIAAAGPTLWRPSSSNSVR